LIASILDLETGPSHRLMFFAAMSHMCLIHLLLQLSRVRQHSALSAVSGREHSAVTVTELLQPLDLACGTLFRSSCAIQTSPTDCWDDSWRDTSSGCINKALC